MKNTFSDEQWLRENESAIKAIMPKTWTHIDNLNGVQIGYGLKLLGVNWRNKCEFGEAMTFLVKSGIVLMNSNNNIKANPHSIFKITERNLPEPPK